MTGTNLSGMQPEGGARLSAADVSGVDGLGGDQRSVDLPAFEEGPAAEYDMRRLKASFGIAGTRIQARLQEAAAAMGAAGTAAVGGPRRSDSEGDARVAPKPGSAGPGPGGAGVVDNEVDVGRGAVASARAGLEDFAEGKAEPPSLEAWLDGVGNESVAFEAFDAFLDDSTLSEEKRGDVAESMLDMPGQKGESLRETAAVRVVKQAVTAKGLRPETLARRIRKAWPYLMRMPVMSRVVALLLLIADGCGDERRSRSLRDLVQQLQLADDEAAMAVLRNIGEA